MTFEPKFKVPLVHRDHKSPEQTKFNTDITKALSETQAATGRLLGEPKIYTEDGNYIQPSNVKAFIVECVGGGGGGGGAQFSSPNGAQGAGGGGGAYLLKYVAKPSGSLFAYTIGAGGAGGSTAGGGGSNGGSTTFKGAGIELTAFGAFGGTGQTAGSSVAVVEGAGSNTPTGGDINLRGQPGTPSIRTGAATGVSGNGGGSFYGSGGAGNDASAAGQAGQGYGGGGAGGTAHSSSQAGGAGASGVVIIWELS